MQEKKYEWLETESIKRNKWIEQQNKQTAQILDKQKSAAENILKFIDREWTSHPTVIREWLVYFRKEHGQLQPTLYLQRWPKGAEEVLIDPNKEFPDGETTIAGLAVNENGKYLSYGLSTHGSDWLQWKTLNLETKKEIPDNIPKLAYTRPTWLSDCSGYYYSRSPQYKQNELTKVGQRIYLHQPGNDWRDDKEIFGKDIPDHHFLSMDHINEDGDFAIIYESTGFENNHIHLLNTQTGHIIQLTKDINSRFSAQIEGDRLYILSNHEHWRFQLYKTTLDNPSIENWKVAIPADVKWKIDNFSVHGKKIYTTKSLDGVYQLIEHVDSNESKIQLPGRGTCSVPTGRHEIGALFYSFENFTTPKQVFLLQNSNPTPWAKNKPAYTPPVKTQRGWVTSKDGTKIPCYIISQENINAKAPTILYGYGGFGYSLEPTYSPQIAHWVNEGGVYVVANIRGGGEYGKQWHKQGKGHNKQNVFDDFISVAEGLVGQRELTIEGNATIVTTQKQLGILGGSNGGLLVGACLVQKPKLFGAAVGLVGLYDMLKFHLTEGGTYWKEEYGNPEDPKDKQYLRSYSPFHNIKETKYPPTLIRTSLGDDRGVDPMHSMKFAAKLQDNQLADNPILLKVDVNSGHGGGENLKIAAQQMAELYCFFNKYI